VTAAISSHTIPKERTVINQPPTATDLIRCRRWVDHDFPAIVQTWITEHDITQGQLAQLLDLARPSVVDRLHGRVRFTAAETLLLLSMMKEEGTPWQDKTTELRWKHD
jgi:predicted XRE-type DNA-binding protein